MGGGSAICTCREGRGGADGLVPVDGGPALGVGLGPVKELLRPVPAHLISVYSHPFLDCEGPCASVCMHARVRLRLRLKKKKRPDQYYITCKSGILLTHRILLYSPNSCVGRLLL